ncbi:hypothetical protein C064_00430 [Brucella suis 63/252]|nr:hypothetical protein DK60_924 [Brucella canis]ENQ57329.1 hypothetical protein C969_00782 [Brucella canis CNGB 1172]ENQ59969.1 hypothetical protein C979_00311 [Brucella canis UK10/02]ENR16119.1 hypothetical protein C064_00430 [Brucella suis 63/252]ENS48551.1 hypothetical protein B976_00314 [Brucella canis 79/122]ENS51161.1 hypothetical protein C968_00758 [Brucella canis CNGB 513]ENT30403.1 hypothetical protein C037_00777 [Brucella suis 63/198]ENX67349.1 hypothetical protein C967_00678 [Bru
MPSRLPVKRPSFVTMARTSWRSISPICKVAMVIYAARAWPFAVMIGTE